MGVCLAWRQTRSEVVAVGYPGGPVTSDAGMTEAGIIVPPTLQQQVGERGVAEEVTVAARDVGGVGESSHN